MMNMIPSELVRDFDDVLYQFDMKSRKEKNGLILAEGLQTFLGPTCTRPKAMHFLVPSNARNINTTTMTSIV